MSKRLQLETKDQWKWHIKVIASQYSKDVFNWADFRKGLDFGMGNRQAPKEFFDAIGELLEERVIKKHSKATEDSYHYADIFFEVGDSWKDKPSWYDLADCYQRSHGVWLV